MEIDNLIVALEKTLSFLRQSESSNWAGLSCEEVIKQLEVEMNKAKNSQIVDLHKLGYLYAPTSSIQEISIDNGWGNEFLEMSKIIDSYTNTK